MEKPETYRLFIAISLPERVKGEMLRAQSELRKAMPEGCLRWTGAEQWHLTLKFLGNVEAARLEALADGVRKAMQTFPSLALRAAGIGFFPDARRPRVVWAGVRDQEDLLPKLQGAIEAAMVIFTSEKPEARFTGHVTLARAKMLNRSEAGMLGKSAARLADQCFGDWRADAVEIIRSRLSPQGSQYSIVETVPLGSLNR